MVPLLSDFFTIFNPKSKLFSVLVLNSKLHTDFGPKNLKIDMKQEPNFKKII